MPAPHKLVLKDLLERLEAAVERLEAVAPHSETPTDPAAQAAADAYIEQRKHELQGEGAAYE